MSLNPAHQGASWKPLRRVASRDELPHAAAIREQCRIFVQELRGHEDVDFAALWVGGALVREGGSGYVLAASAPEGRAATDIAPEHEVALWAAESGSVAWMARERPPLGLVSRERQSGVFMMFTLNHHLILGASLGTDDAPIEGVQALLAGLSARITDLVADAPPVWAEDLPVDLGFLEATAMGDVSFLNHMLDLCVTELRSGSEALAEAVSRQAASEVVFHAHKMRSTARTSGAETLDGFLAMVEERAEGGDFSAVPDALEAAEHAISAITRILSKAA